ncbi:MAG: MASE1 domain-containing protein [Gammaproteobacteria bacterium]|nr:MASE1 domain-containing protein [Gammaproteobacteria bacterium]
MLTNSTSPNVNKNSSAPWWVTWRALLGINLLVAFSYYAITYLLLLPIDATSSLRLIIICSPVGFALLGMFYWGYRITPGLYLGFAYAITPVVAEMYQVKDWDLWILVALIAAAKIFQVVALMWILKKFAKVELVFEELRATFIYIFSAYLSAGIALLLTTMAVFLVNPAFGSARFDNASNWLLADIVSLTLITPVLCLWLNKKFKNRPLIRRVEFFALVIAGLVVGYVMFSGQYDHPILKTPFCLFSLMLWSFLRFGVREIVTIFAIFCLFAIWGGSQGHGPFPFQDPSAWIFQVQIVVAVLMPSTLLISILQQESVRKSRTLQELTNHLEQRVRDRTNDIDWQIRSIQLIGDVALIANQTTLDINKALEQVLYRACTFLNCPLGHIYLRSNNLLENDGVLTSSSIWYMERPGEWQDFKKRIEEMDIPADNMVNRLVTIKARTIWLSAPDNYEENPKVMLSQKIGVKSTIVMPVLIGDKVTAVLEFIFFEEQQASNEIASVLERAGLVLGQLFERQQYTQTLNTTNLKLQDALAETQQQYAAIDLLHRVAIAVNQTFDLHVAMRKSLRIIAEHIDAGLAHIYLVSGEHKNLVSSNIWYSDGAHDYAAYKEFTEQHNLDPGENPFEYKMLNSPTALWLGDPADFLEFPKAKVGAAIGLKSSMVMPVAVDNKIVAVLEYGFWHTRQGDAVTTALLEKAALIFSRLFERQQAEEKQTDLNNQLIRASRQAGMAEVASGVLHNVGNVLNSVNVSAMITADKLQNIKTEGLRKAVQMLRDNQKSLTEFVNNDAKGSRLFEYMEQFGDYIESEKKISLQEMRSVSDNIEHIKNIVKRQQTYARVGAMRELIEINYLINDAIEMNAPKVDRFDIEIKRNYAKTPAFYIDKHDVLQIVGNLIRNAKHALQIANIENRCITITTRMLEERVYIDIEDNGQGISEKIQKSIFEFGFTTKKDGHGFGLHASANAARAMGGRLTFYSAGEGQGACFTLELPCDETGTDATH